MRRRDHWLGNRVAAPDDLFLMDRHRLRRRLYAQIAACNHDPIRSVNNIVDVINGLALLYFGDECRVAFQVTTQPAQFTHIVATPDERHGDVIYFLLNGKFDINPVFVRDRGEGQVSFGSTDALPRTERPTDNDLAHKIIVVLGENLEFQLSVVQQQTVARLHIFDKFWIRQGENHICAVYIACGQGQAISCYIHPRPDHLT